MTNHLMLAPGLVLLSIAAGCTTPSQEARAMSSPEPVVHARGSFDVRTAPQSPDNPQAQASGVARLSLDKTFHGTLQAASQGEMLATGGGEGDGAYVAMEKVTGTLDGRAGSFALVHRALMRDSTPVEWTVTVVPGSGTGDLTGLEGTMSIRIEGGQHLYDFEYTLPSGK